MALAKAEVAALLATMKGEMALLAQLLVGGAPASPLGALAWA